MEVPCSPPPPSEVWRHNGALVHARHGSESMWTNLDQVDPALLSLLPPECHHSRFSGMQSVHGVTEQLRKACADYATFHAAATHLDVIPFMIAAFDSTLGPDGCLKPRPRSMVLCDGAHYRVLLFSPSDVAHDGSNVVYAMDSLWGPSGWDMESTKPLVKELHNCENGLGFKLVVRCPT